MYGEFVFVASKTHRLLLNHIKTINRRKTKPATSHKNWSMKKMLSNELLRHSKSPCNSHFFSVSSYYFFLSHRNKYIQSMFKTKTLLELEMIIKACMEKNLRIKSQFCITPRARVCLIWVKLILELFDFVATQFRHRNTCA